MLAMITAGIDIGSRTAKVVFLHEERMLVSRVVPVADAVGRVAARLLHEARKEVGLSRWERVRIGATGAGMKAVKRARPYPVALCVARAVSRAIPTAKAAIDAGGLTTRVIVIKSDGGLADYLENERCAAGSGRFLETVAEALETPLAEIGPLSLRARQALPVTNQCVVFAESEVINHVNAGEEPAEILAGLHKSIAERIASLARRLGVKAPVVLVGGVARNEGVVRFLAQALGSEILLPAWNPQLAAALGAALLAAEEATAGFFRRARLGRWERGGQSRRAEEQEERMVGGKR